MIGTGKRLATALTMGWVAALSFPHPTLAQSGDFVLDRTRYTLTLPAGWDSVAVPEGQAGAADLSVIAKLDGLGGLAYVSCEPGTTAPNLDSLGADYSAILGATVTKGRDSSVTLGKYQVKWQEFKYDSLPILSDMIQARAPFLPRIGKDSLRVYYLVSGGYVFTVAGLRVIARTTPPYADIETAIKTLVLKPISGGVRFASRGLGGGLRVVDGMLGGDWLKAHPALSVDCFALDGAFFAAARSTGNGEWILPAGRQAMVVKVRALDGNSVSVLARP